ncbi:MAG: DUF5522 domain-containing protein [Chitinophagaceae bacterium]
MEEAMIEGVDFYYDENGYMVLTAEHHEKRGYCCGHGCRHCPFDYECVPEPKKSQMIAMGFPKSKKK